jgi:Insulinase (Peptidase family M16)
MSLYRVGAHGLLIFRSVIRESTRAAGSTLTKSLLLRASRLPHYRSLHYSPQILYANTVSPAISLYTPPHLRRRHISTYTIPELIDMVEPLNNRAAPPLQRVANSMERPALDNRSYRVVKLQNELEALLIHDPETDKASGALDVNVGSFSDKDDMPGLAHAVEHMLFMGTEKVC